MLKRFLQPDPSSRDGVRSYVYAHDDPLDRADPSGLSDGCGPSSEEGGATDQPCTAPGTGADGDASNAGGPGSEGTVAGPEGLAGAEVPLGSGAGAAGASDGILGPDEVVGGDNVVALDETGSQEETSTDGAPKPTDDFVRGAAITSARAARRRIGRVPFGKTVAAVLDGRRTLSGWAQKPGYEQTTNKVMARAQEMGYTFAEHPFDRGVPGRFNASHAEPQMTEVAPGQPFAVSREMCPSCQDYLSNLAQYTQEPVTVADPATVRVFYPDGTVEIIPGP